MTASELEAALLLCSAEALKKAGQLMIEGKLTEAREVLSVASARYALLIQEWSDRA